MFFDITFNPHAENKFGLLKKKQKNARARCFNSAGCDVGKRHFIMTDPGESKVTIWPLATFTDPCFNMQMYLFVQP